MKDNYDFSKGVKNPYINKLKKGYTIRVHYDFTQHSIDNEDTGEKKTPDKKQLELPKARP